MNNNESLADIVRRIRRDALEMIYRAKSGHPGGSMSLAEIMGALFFGVMKIDENNPKWEERDRFILSKGHAAPILYASLVEKGFVSKKEIAGFRQLNGLLQGHPVPSVPGVETVSGSLGGGFSVATGMAKALKIKNNEAAIFVVLGDGEINEGVIWEAAMSAAHFKLDNMVAILDRNNFQNDGECKEVMDTLDVAKKWEAFGWDVTTIDGHNLDGLLETLTKKKNERQAKPKMIVANTIKGKGVAYLEKDFTTHYRPPTEDEWAEASKELS